MPERVAFVIPALDEEGAIAGVLDALKRAGTAGFESAGIVVADNGSSDRTAERARAAGAVVVTEPRRGYGSACLAALAHLRADPPDVVVFVDADGSDDPADLPGLLEPVGRGTDLVIGTRSRGEPDPGALAPAQIFGNTLASFLLAALFGGRFSDLGPFRAIRWTALEKLDMRDRDYGWTVEMQARALRAGLACAEVPVRYRRRRAGRSKVAGTLRGSIGAGWKILVTIARVRFGG